MDDRFDPVSSPMHYAGDGRIECKDALSSMLSVARVTAKQAYWWGCAFKYLWRWPLKNGVEDLRKAEECLTLLIAEAEDDEL